MLAAPSDWPATEAAVASDLVVGVCCTALPAAWLMARTTCFFNAAFLVSSESWPVLKSYNHPHHVWAMQQPGTGEVICKQLLLWCRRPDSVSLLVCDYTTSASICSCAYYRWQCPHQFPTLQLLVCHVSCSLVAVLPLVKCPCAQSLQHE